MWSHCYKFCACFSEWHHHNWPVLAAFHSDVSFNIYAPLYTFFVQFAVKGHHRSTEVSQHTHTHVLDTSICSMDSEEEISLLVHITCIK